MEPIDLESEESTTETIVGVSSEISVVSIYHWRSGGRGRFSSVAVVQEPLPCSIIRRWALETGRDLQTFRAPLAAGHFPRDRTTAWKVRAAMQGEVRVRAVDGKGTEFLAIVLELESFVFRTSCSSQYPLTGSMADWEEIDLVSLRRSQLRQVVSMETSNLILQELRASALQLATCRSPQARVARM
jgi:hypothetical protein